MQRGRKKRGRKEGIDGKRDGELGREGRIGKEVGRDGKMETEASCRALKTSGKKDPNSDTLK